MEPGHVAVFVTFFAAVWCQNVSYKVDTTQNIMCDLQPKEENLPQRIHGASKRLHMVIYNVVLPEYTDSNPLRHNMTSFYKAHHWQRVFTDKGRKMSALGFNFGALSLSLLSHNTEDWTLEMLDAPKGCFARLNEVTKVRKIRTMLMQDFDDRVRHGDDATVCYDAVENSKFSHKCCKWATDGIECHSEENNHMQWIYYVILSLKIMTLLFGPCVVQRLFFRKTQVSRYTVPLKEDLAKTLLLKKLRRDDLPSKLNNKKKVQDFAKFRQIVKHVNSDEVLLIHFKSLHIQVDNSELIAESDRGPGVLSFVFKFIFGLGFSRFEPFSSCCTESIFGTWSKRFLWIKLFDRFECNDTCRKVCSWFKICQLLRALLFIVLAVVPYILRSILYYAFEDDEMTRRVEAADRLDLDYQFSFESCLFHWVSPSHGLLVAMYIAYIGASIVLLVLSMLDQTKVKTIVNGAMEDLANVSYIAIVKMFCIHLVMPFEKFGLVIGLLVAAIYWVFALPLCIITLVMYGIPTIYLTGRFLITSRLPCLRECPLPTDSKPKADDVTSDGPDSFETCLLLNNISPDQFIPQEKPIAARKSFRCHLGQMCGGLKSLMIGIFLVLNMYILLFMYAEVFGYFIQIFIFTAMSALLNVSSAAKYIILAGWLSIYYFVSFNQLCTRYRKLRASIFSHLKSKLDDDVKRSFMGFLTTSCFAFKYFSQRDIEDHATESKGKTQPLVDDVFADSKGRLYWRITSLALFIDDNDVAHIPSKLFAEVCNLQVPGSPGPLHKCIIQATKGFVVLIFYWISLVIVVFAVDDIEEVSTTNHILFTMFLGFLPVLMKVVYQSSNPVTEVNEYTYSCKIANILRQYTQKWPICDLDFETQNSAETLPLRSRDQAVRVKTSRRLCSPSMFNAPDIVDPTHVDLLITIRDESDHALNARVDSHQGFTEEIPKSVGGTESTQHENQNTQNDQRLHGSQCPQLSKGGNQNRRVDLVVDLARSGVQVRELETTDNSAIQLRSMGQNYDTLPQKDSEAAV